MLTKQEAFDRAYNGIINQGCFSKTKQGSCKYYTAPGVYCGIGHLLPDDETRQRWDDYDHSDISSIPIEDLRNVGLSHLEDDRFLTQIQAAHDLALDMADFINVMRDVARENGLVVPETDNWAKAE